MDYNNILNNIQTFLDNASPEDMAKIDEIFTSKSEEDITLDEYLNAISGQYFYTRVKTEDSPLYVSTVASLNTNQLQYENICYTSSISHYDTVTQEVELEARMSLSKLINKAA